MINSIIIIHVKFRIKENLPEDQLELLKEQIETTIAKEYPEAILEVNSDDQLTSENSVMVTVSTPPNDVFAKGQAIERARGQAIEKHIEIKENVTNIVKKILNQQ